MEAYCSIIHMTISTDQTKVRVLGDHASPSFMCNGQVVEQVPSSKYLGLHLHEAGLVSHLMTPLKAKMSASSAVVQRRRALIKCGDTVNLKLKLLQTILVPTIHYGCEVWGMHSQRTSSANSARSQLQHLYELYLRRICRLSPSVPAAMLLSELNLLPLKVFGGGSVYGFGTSWLQHHLTLFTGQSCLAIYKMLCAFMYATFLALWLLHFRVWGIQCLLDGLCYPHLMLMLLFLVWSCHSNSLTLSA